MSFSTLSISSSASSFDEKYDLFLLGLLSGEFPDRHPHSNKRSRVFESRHDRSPNRLRFRKVGAAIIDRDYFCRLPENANEEPLASYQTFHLRFSVSRGKYEYIRAGLLQNPDFFSRVLTLLV